MYFFSLKKYCLIVLLSVTIFGCKENVTEPEPENSVITGSVLFLDGTAGASATIELKDLSNNLRVYEIADVNGIYKFDSLRSGKYIVKFKSVSYNIITFEQELTLKNNDIYEQDVFILYNMVDDLSAVQKSNDVFLIKFQADGARIGNNYNLVNYLSGYYSGDYSNLYSMACDIYKCPDTLDWSSEDMYFEPDYIRQNFEFITSVDETFGNGRHEIRFYENDIANILSTPPNGFAFVKKNNDASELKIPCVDFNNNDFGLRINYKQ